MTRKSISIGFLHGKKFTVDLFEVGETVLNNVLLPTLFLVANNTVDPESAARN